MAIPFIPAIAASSLGVAGGAFLADAYQIYRESQNLPNPVSHMHNTLAGLSPDISGYTFIIMQPPDLSGITNPTIIAGIRSICDDMILFGLDFTPPSIIMNTEEINTQSSISMPYATTKVATGEMNITFLDNNKQDINAMHNTWIEYLYNQLWGDITPATKYYKPGDPAFGALDYATSLYVLKYDASVGNDMLGGKGTQLPSMVGKATGIFPTEVPVKEVLGSRSSNELTMQSVNYTCSYFEVMYPRSDIDIPSSSTIGTIWDECQAIIKSQYSSTFSFFG